MSTFNVSNSRELDSALDSARGGDEIVLEQGNYDALEINGRHQSNLDSNETITIASASASRPAVFEEMDLRNVSNLTLEGLKFDDDGGAGGKAFVVYSSSGITIRNASFEGVVENGYAANFGLQVLEAEDITVEGSEFRNFTKASSFIDIEDLNVRNNDFYGSSIDSMVFGDVHDARIEGNEVHEQKVNAKHTDLIQFWAVTKDGVSTDVVIKDNVLRSGGDGETHGIYIGNEIFEETGSRSDFYENFLIEDNTIVSGQYHGLTVGAIDGLVIRNNEVLQDSSAPNKGVTIPRIVVADEAVDVRITDNTAHMISDDGGESWDVPGNEIVPLGQRASGRSGGDDGNDDSDDSRVDGPAGPVTSGGDGEAETFRFEGDDVRGRERDEATGVDFDEGDEIVFIDYDRDTFDDSWRDSNHVANNSEGTYVRVDSVADLQEISAASDDVSARVEGDTLVLTIDQNAGTHRISFDGLGNGYDALF